MEKPKYNFLGYVFAFTLASITAFPLLRNSNRRRRKRSAASAKVDTPNDIKVDAANDATVDKTSSVKVDETINIKIDDDISTGKIVSVQKGGERTADNTKEVLLKNDGDIRESLRRNDSWKIYSGQALDLMECTKKDSEGNAAAMVFKKKTPQPKPSSTITFPIPETEPSSNVENNVAKTGSDDVTALAPNVDSGEISWKVYSNQAFEIMNDSSKDQDQLEKEPSPTTVPENDVVAINGSKIDSTQDGKLIVNNAQINKSAEDELKKITMSTASTVSTDGSENGSVHANETNKITTPNLDTYKDVSNVRTRNNSDLDSTAGDVSVSSERTSKSKKKSLLSKMASKTIRRKTNTSSPSKTKKKSSKKTLRQQNSSTSDDYSSVI